MKAQPLADALTEIAQKFGLQVVFFTDSSGALSSPRLAGVYTPVDAFKRVLHGTGLKFEFLGDRTVRVFAERTPDQPNSVMHPVQRGQAQSAQATTSQQIIISASKRNERILDVPASITVFSRETLETLAIRQFADYGTRTANLSFSYGVGNLGFTDARAIAIRGISGIGTTGLYLDDTRIPESVDPRIADLERIEVIRGPQGALFGAGSLGGSIRLVSATPDPETHSLQWLVGAGRTQDSPAPGWTTRLIANGSPGNESLTWRASMFLDRQPGWLTRTFPRADNSLRRVDGQGGTATSGGSLALMWRLSGQTVATFRILGQMQRHNGWPAPYAPFATRTDGTPGYWIDSFNMKRAADVQEQSSDSFFLPSLKVEYSTQAFDIYSTTSYLERRSFELEDGTEGTRWTFEFGGYGLQLPPDQAIPWNTRGRNKQLSHETRVSFAPRHGMSGLIGLYLAKASHEEILSSGDIAQAALRSLTSFPGYCNTANPTDSSCSTYGSALGWLSARQSALRDTSLFGELNYKLRNVGVSLGARAYKLNQDRGVATLAGALNRGESTLTVPDTAQSGLNPKIGLSYGLNAEQMVYFNFAKGFRAGGGGPILPAFCGLVPQLGDHYNAPATFKSDSVASYEVGAKSAFHDGNTLVTAALFQMNWNDIQQPVLLPDCFITITANAGDAVSRGAEFEMQTRVNSYVDLRTALGYDDAHITRSVLPWQPVGSRVYQVPHVTAMAAVGYTRPLGAKTNTFVNIDASYTGASTSGTAGLQNSRAADGTYRQVPVRAGYKLVNARCGLSWQKSSLELYASNLTHERPNLGDLNPISYAQRTAFASDAQVVPRVATLPPLTVGVEFRLNF